MLPVNDRALSPWAARALGHARSVPVRVRRASRIFCGEVSALPGKKKKKKSSGRIRPPSRRLSRRTSPLPTVTCHQTSLVSPVGNVRTIGRRSKQRVETFSLPLPMYRGYDSACASFTGGDHGTGTHFSLWYHHGRHAFIRVEVDTWGNILHLSIFRKYGPPALVTAASFKRPCEAVSPLWRASLTIS